MRGIESSRTIRIIQGMTMRKSLTFLAALAGILGWTGLAVARCGDGMAEPAKSDELTRMVWPLVYTLAFVAATCVIGFKSAKRSQIN